jgi:arginine decarboxylase
VDAQILERRLRMLQSSSPSYPILASLDWARSLVHGKRGHEAFRNGLDSVRAFRNALHAGRRFGMLRQETFSSYARLDPFKVTIYDKEGTLSGYRLQALLSEQGCDAEMADDRHVLFVFGMASSLFDADRLNAALEQIESRFCGEKQEKRLKMKNNRPLWPKASPQPVFFDFDGVRKPPNAAELPVEVPVEHSAGALSAEMVVPYPPGIPLLYPGERITPEAVEFLLTYRSQGASVQGIRDKTLQRILVWNGDSI